MEGLYFEVKPGSSDKPSTNNCPSPSRLPSKSSTPCLHKPAPSSGSADATAWREIGGEEEVRYRLTSIGSLPVHHLTTMAMLPWVVAEIVRARPVEMESGVGVQPGGPRGAQLDLPMRNQTVFLCVATSRVQCVRVWDEKLAWDPLSHTVLFECRPHQVTKLIHNSQEPSSFGCLVRDAPNCACYVFQCQDSAKVQYVCVCMFIC